MRFPSIKDVTRALRNVRDTLDPTCACTETGNTDSCAVCDGNGAPHCDVRLQVYPDGEWAIRWGSSDYDQDHTGFWGASCISPTDLVKDLRETAKDLLDQAREHHAMSGED